MTAPPSARWIPPYSCSATTSARSGVQKGTSRTVVLDRKTSNTLSPLAQSPHTVAAFQSEEAEMPKLSFFDGRAVPPTPMGGVDRFAAWKAAIAQLRGGGAPHPRAVSAVSAGGPSPRAVRAGSPLHQACTPSGPPHRQACTPLGDKVPLQRAFDNLRSGPPSAFQQLRELHEQHKREDVVIRAVLRLARAARRRAWRPPVVHACPASTPRPREGGARMVAASGRDGTAERDDGGGKSDGGGDGDGPSRAHKSSRFSGRRS
jgi:hypothetical protein